MLSKYKDVLIECGLLDVYIQGVMEKATEDAYIELSELYNWDKIECVKDDKIKTIDEISKEIIEIIKEMDD